ncbi:MAG: tripartite tricarboxylate transporter substrate binding protein, partial [Burkholderiales bacterium]|nr:tripartite tricarboxylate transporter substrate binding protein [Burkholderiales bacterium]
PSISPHVKAGKLKALAVTSANRATGLPDLPTIAESGVQGYSMSGWFGLMAPKATSGSVISSVNKAASKALETRELRGLFTSMGLEPVGNSPSDFSKFIHVEIEKYGNLVKKTGLRL